MKFDRYFKFEFNLEPTEKQLKNEKRKINRKIKKELDSMPLFASILEQELETKYSKSDLEILEKKRKDLIFAKKSHSDRRNWIAKQWRKFRKAFQELSKEHQKIFIQKWDNAGHPKAHEYALDCLRQYYLKNNIPIPKIMEINFFSNKTQY